VPLLWLVPVAAGVAMLRRRLPLSVRWRREARSLLASGTRALEAVTVPAVMPAFWSDARVVEPIVSEPRLENWDQLCPVGRGVGA
jgi:hypothetical protein